MVTYDTHQRSKSHPISKIRNPHFEFKIAKYSKIKKKIIQNVTVHLRLIAFSCEMQPNKKKKHCWVRK